MHERTIGLIDKFFTAGNRMRAVPLEDGNDLFVVREEGGKMQAIVVGEFGQKHVPVKEVEKKKPELMALLKG